MVFHTKCERCQLDLDEFSETEAFNWRLQQLTSLNLPGDTCRKYSTASSAVLLAHVKVPFFGTWMRAMAGVAIGGFNSVHFLKQGWFTVHP
jgi:hypothetical protein